MLLSALAGERPELLTVPSPLLGLGFILEQSEKRIKLLGQGQIKDLGTVSPNLQVPKLSGLGCLTGVQKHESDPGLPVHYLGRIRRLRGVVQIACKLRSQ